MEVRYCLMKGKTISNSDFKEFEELVPLFLKDLEKKYNVKYVKGCVNCADVHAVLASKKLTNSVFGKDEKIDFSWTNLDCNVIMFCFENWKKLKLDKSKNDNELYKKYVVLHEFMHAFPFYLDHNMKDCNENGKYNVMYQQTRTANNGGECRVKEIYLPIISSEKFKNEFLNYNKSSMKTKKENFFKKILEFNS